MAIAQKVGSTGLLLQPVRAEFTPERGFAYETPYEGTDAAAAISYANTLASRRIPVSLESDGKTYRVSIRQQGVQFDPASGAEVPHDNWEIRANEVHKDVYESPLALQAESISPGILAVLRDGVKRYNEGSFLEGNFDDDVPTEVIDLFRLLIRGTTHYPTDQYVLKHAQTISQEYAANVVDANIGRLFTTAQLLTECAGYTFPLPGRMINKINAIEAPAAQDNYLWSWRKLPSPEVTIPGGRIEVNTEYHLDQWSTALYALAV